VSHAGSLPADIPRRLARRPHLAVALLRWRNACRRERRRLLGTAAVIVALALAVLAAPPAAAALRWLARSPVVTFAFGACLFGLSAIRRQERIQSEAATSWLAALPVPGSSIFRLVLGAVARLFAAIAFLGLAWAVGRLAMLEAWRLAGAVAAGALAGTLAGLLTGLSQRARAGAGSPGWHYASVRRSRSRWATAPSLTPLSYWPLAQGRLFSRPRTSRLVLFALLAIPAGRRDPGELALAVAAGCLTAFTLAALSTAAVRAATDAARWLAPTTLRVRAFIVAFIWGIAVKQAAVLAVVIFLACAVNRAVALRAGLPLAAAYVALSCAAAAVACARASRRLGLGAARRGA
jgi:hypothetical protein